MFFSCTVVSMLTLSSRAALPCNLTLRKQLIDTFRADALSKMHQFAAVARQFAAESGETAKCLVVRVTLELQHYRFVAEVF